MDQDSRTDESRERALSSEPSSTRPNPFDDDDSNLSARKRRRTSLSGSPSASVRTALSYDNTIVASDTHDMKVDTPEPTLPSTPDRPDRPAEPVSSRVTINLRNADSLEATPTSPTSPTPSGHRPGHVRDSVEAPEIDMAPTNPVDDGSSSSSTFGSPEPAVISVEDLEDDIQFATREPQCPFRTADLGSIVSDFPYRCEGELPHDTVARLSNYFRQRKLHGSPPYISLFTDPQIPEPANVDDGLLSIHNWLNRCLSSARLELRTTILEVYRENRVFWVLLPDLFYHFGQRYVILAAGFPGALIPS